MEHTNEFLQGMFAAYMGCEVMDVQNGKRMIFTGITFHEELLYYVDSHDSIHEEVQDYVNCKPILTPLSEITDEDAVEVVSIGGWSPQNQGQMLDCRFDFNSNEFIANFEFSRYRVVLDFHVIDYLRSKHYDCGYMHVPSLIDAGLAVKSTK